MDFFDFLFEETRKRLGPYFQQAEEAARYKNELKLTIVIYIFANIILYFIAPNEILFVWICMNILIAFVIKNLFFASPLKRKGGHYKSQNIGPATFFEGACYEENEIPEKHPQAKKTDKKQDLNETFELINEEPASNSSFTTIKASPNYGKPQKHRERRHIVRLEEEPIFEEENLDLSNITKQVPETKYGLPKDLSAISEVLTESGVSEREEPPVRRSGRKIEFDDDPADLVKELGENMFKSNWSESTITKQTSLKKEPEVEIEEVVELAEEAKQEEVNEEPRLEEIPVALENLRPSESSFSLDRLIPETGSSSFIASLKKNIDEKQNFRWSVPAGNLQESRVEPQESSIWNRSYVEASKENQPWSLVPERFNRQGVIEQKPAFESQENQKNLDQNPKIENTMFKKGSTPKVLFNQNMMLKKDSTPKVLIKSKMSSQTTKLHSLLVREDDE